jgi:alkylhydroperoxidase family enzyme
MPQRPTSEVLTAVLRADPAVAGHLADAYDAAWRVVDPVLLELCRLRVAMLLDCDAEQAARTPAATEGGLQESTVAELARWPTSSRFGPRERACLGFCEQFVMDVATMPDELVREVADHLGAQGLADLVTALLVVEQRQRLRLAWEALAVPGTA